MTARTCATCVHRIRWHREQICTRPLTAIDIPVERLRHHLSMLEPCATERTGGWLWSVLTMSCGQSGRYWSDK